MQNKLYDKLLKYHLGLCFIGFRINDKLKCYYVLNLCTIVLVGIKSSYIYLRNVSKLLKLKIIQFFELLQASTVAQLSQFS